MKLCYITAFIDLHRENWTHFSRTTEEYITSFRSLTNLFVKNPSPDFSLIVFTDSNTAEKIGTLITSNITIVILSESELGKFPAYKRMKKDREIMDSSAFRELVPKERENCPECKYPEYNTVNHAKVDFVMKATEMVRSEFYAWVDFGYCSTPDRVPEDYLDVNLFDPNKVTFSIINPEFHSDDPVFHIKNAPEVMGGFFFVGKREILGVYQRFYHSVHDWFQAQGITDDDQAVSLQVYLRAPSLFALKKLGWHKAVHYYALNPLTRCMTMQTSDKSSHHHTYTRYYHTLFRDYTTEEFSLLEIGIGSIDPSVPSNMAGTKHTYRPGASLRGWRDYFPRAKIYGADIDDKVLFTEDRIETFRLDQTDLEQLRVEAGRRKYKIIVDDSLHVLHANWSAYKILFQAVEKTGVYIIEDVCTLTDDEFRKVAMDNPYDSVVEYVRLENFRNKSDNNLIVVKWQNH